MLLYIYTRAHIKSMCKAPVTQTVVPKCCDVLSFCLNTEKDRSGHCSHSIVSEASVAELVVSLWDDLTHGGD